LHRCAQLADDSRAAAAIGRRHGLIQGA
jgi:hypothetical protein